MVQLKIAVSELNNSKRLAKKIVEPSTLWNNNLVKILKWADNWNIIHNLAKFEIWKVLKISNFVSTVVRTLFKVLMIFTWRIKRCKTDCR